MANPLTPSSHQVNTGVSKTPDSPVRAPVSLNGESPQAMNNVDAQRTAINPNQNTSRHSTIQHSVKAPPTIPEPPKETKVYFANLKNRMFEGLNTTKEAIKSAGRELHHEITGGNFLENRKQGLSFVAQKLSIIEKQTSYDPPIKNLRTEIADLRKQLDASVTKQTNIREAPQKNPQMSLAEVQSGRVALKEEETKTKDLASKIGAKEAELKPLLDKQAAERAGFKDLKDSLRETKGEIEQGYKEFKEYFKDDLSAPTKVDGYIQGQQFQIADKQRKLDAAVQAQADLRASGAPLDRGAGKEALTKLDSQIATLLTEIKDHKTQLEGLLKQQAKERTNNSAFNKDMEALKNGVVEGASNLRDAVASGAKEFGHYTGIARMERPKIERPLSPNDQKLEEAKAERQKLGDIIIGLIDEKEKLSDQLEVEKKAGRDVSNINLEIEMYESSIASTNNDIIESDSRLDTLSETKRKEDAAWHPTMGHDVNRAKEALVEAAKSTVNAVTTSFREFGHYTGIAKIETPSIQNVSTVAPADQLERRGTVENPNSIENKRIEFAQRFSVGEADLKDAAENAANKTDGIYRDAVPAAIAPETKNAEKAKKSDAKQNFEPLPTNTTDLVVDLKTKITQTGTSPHEIIALCNKIENDKEFFQTLPQEDKDLIQAQREKIDQASFKQMLTDLTNLSKEKNPSSLHIIALCTELGGKNMSTRLNPDEKKLVDEAKKKAQQALGISGENTFPIVQTFFAARALGLNPGKQMGSLEEFVQSSGFISMAWMETQYTTLDPRTGKITEISKEEFENIPKELKVLSDKLSQEPLTDDEQKKFQELKYKEQNAIKSAVPSGAFKAMEAIMKDPNFPLEGKQEVVRSVSAWASTPSTLTRNPRMVELANDIADTAHKSTNESLKKEGANLKEVLKGLDLKPVKSAQIQENDKTKNFDDICSSVREKGYTKNKVKQMATAFQIKGLHYLAQHDIADAVPGSQGRTDLKLGFLANTNSNMITESILLKKKVDAENNVTTELASPKEVKRMIKFYIKVGKKAANNGDFQTLFALSVALNQFPITRCVTDLGSENIKSDIAELGTIISPSGSFKVIRESYDNAHKRYQKEGGLPPTFPHPVFGNESVFTHEGNPNFTKEELEINESKLEITQNSLNKMKLNAQEANHLLNNNNLATPVRLPETGYEDRSMDYLNYAKEIFPRKPAASP